VNPLLPRLIPAPDCHRRRVQLDVMQQIPSKHGPDRPARPADAIRQLAVPQVAPPYDDEAAPAGTHDEGNGGCRTAPAWTPRGSQETELAVDQPVSPHSAAQGADPRRPDSHGAGAGAWPGQFAQVLAETLAGSRPARQLAPWTTEQARRQIWQLGPLFATGERPVVRRIMTAAPASGVLELTAVVGSGSRLRVLAVRLERGPAGRGWCCTAIEST
jgi:hypothetical protein